MPSTAKSPAAVSRLIHEPAASVEAIDPAQAKLWLDLNTNNRTFRPARIAQYARDMADGRWQVNGEAIKFAADGTLLDGQHRLQAVVESGATIRSLVVRNLPHETQDVMDTGAARAPGDQLSLAGHPNSSALAASAKWALLFDKGMFAGDRTRQVATHSEIKAYVTDNALIADVVARCANRLRKSVDMTPSALAASYYLCARVDPTDAETFFDRLADGASLPAGSPILALRSRLRTVKNDRIRLDVQQYISVTLRAWNAWRGGRRMASIPIFAGNVTIPCPEPK